MLLQWNVWLCEMDEWLWNDLIIEELLVEKLNIQVDSAEWLDDFWFDKFHCINY